MHLYNFLSISSPTINTSTKHQDFGSKQPNDATPNINQIKYCNLSQDYSRKYELMTTRDKVNKAAKEEDKMQQGFHESSIDLCSCNKKKDKRDYLLSFKESNEQGGVGKIAFECKVQSSYGDPGKSKSWWSSNVEPGIGNLRGIFLEIFVNKVRPSTVLDYVPIKKASKKQLMGLDFAHQLG